MNASFLKQTRMDCILIWGHGLEKFNDILNDIGANKNFKILKIQKHKPKSMRLFVKEMYSYDYAPFWHLKAKTKYLLKTEQEVCFIFIKNLDPNEDYFGENLFRHKESLTLKVFKEELRDKYSPYENGERTHNHVIHATDSEAQTEHMLKYLGYEDGVNVLETLKRPKSKYIWWFSDDDEVLPDFMERLLFELDEHKPNVCNVGFLQSPYTEKTPRYGRDIHGFYSDIHTIHEVMSTKLSSIIVKKNGFTFPSEKEVLKSLWPQVLIILPLILTTKSYYIFSCNMAGSDSNYLDIRYPPSAFYDLIVIKRDIYRKYNIEQIFKSKRKEVTRFAVNIHFLLLIMTRKASPTNEVKKNIHSELLYDFFKFGCLNMVNYRSLASFLVKYAQYRAGLIYKKIINIFALNYYKK